MSNDFECSVAAADREEPMFATASRVSGWLFVEVRGAWGKDAVHESALGDHIPAHWKRELKRIGLRALTIRSHARREVEGVHLYTCSAPRPGADRPQLWHREVSSLAHVADATEALRLNVNPGAEWDLDPLPLFLVCTNGRHDQCCANLGRPLVRALRESRWADRVWEASHIGGDRFAANIVALPQSLYFGRVDPAAASALLDSLDQGRIDLEHFRGRTSLSIAEQAVEHFVRLEFEINEIDGVAVGQSNPDGSYQVKIGDRSVTVRIRQQMTAVETPLTCKGPRGQQVPTFALRSIS